MAMAGNNGASPATHFGNQMRKERLAHGWSVHEFARRSGISAGHTSRIENGLRPPTEAVALACDAVYPKRKGWFLEYYRESRDWMPAGFRDWPEIEDKAATLRAWSPGVLHGLLQTEDYARALLETSPSVTGEIVAARLANRMQRQRRMLLRDNPPPAWFVIDELSLYRYVGSPEIMSAQMRHLLAVAALPFVTIQILPAVAHPANASELILTDNAAYTETVLSGQVYSEPESVTAIGLLFHTILSECFRASESRARIGRMAEIWTTGVRAAGPTRTADRA